MSDISYNLYAAAKQFNEQKPWQGLLSTDIFAVKLPDYNEIYYCSVLGKEEKEFGLTIYEGLSGLVNLVETFVKGYESYNDFLLCQDGFAVYFNDKTDLPKEDYDFAANSGLQFSGDKQWPAFRVYKPGFYPVRPTTSDLKLITAILTYAKEFIADLKGLAGKVSFFEQNICYLRTYDINYDYTDQALIIEDLLKGYQRTLNVPVAYDEFSIARLKRDSKKLNSVWEINYFYYPYPVEQDGLIFYPMNLLMVDTETQKIEAQHMTTPVKFAESFQKYILTYIDKHKTRPTEMVTDNQDLFCYLNSMFKGLGIKLTLVDELFLIPHIKKQFTEMLEKENI